MSLKIELNKSNIVDEIKEEIIALITEHYNSTLELLKNNLDKKFNDINVANENKKRELKTKMIDKHNFNDIPILEYFYLSEIDLIRNNKINVNNSDNVNEVTEKIINDLENLYKTRINALTNVLYRKVFDIQKSNDINKKEKINKLINKHNKNDIPILGDFFMSQLRSIKNYKPNLEINNEIDCVDNEEQHKTISITNLHETIADKINKTTLETIAKSALDKIKTDTVTTSETTVTTTSNKSLIETITKTITTIFFTPLDI